MSWRKAAIGQYEKLLVELKLYRTSVSLHLLRDTEKVRAANRLFELPVNPKLGDRDLNYVLMRAIQAGLRLTLRQQGRHVG